jgi:hypothetical protein
MQNGHYWMKLNQVGKILWFSVLIGIPTYQFVSLFTWHWLVNHLEHSHYSSKFNAMNHYLEKLTWYQSTFYLRPKSQCKLNSMSLLALL